MWAKVKKFLLGEGRLVVDKDGKEPSRELQLAAAALLLEAAAADTDVSAAEQKEIIRNLSFEFDMPKRVTKELLDDAEELRLTHADLKPIVEFIRNSFTPEQRVEILSLVWRVVLIDDVLEDYEKLFTESLVPILALDSEQAAAARARADAYLKEGI